MVSMWDMVPVPEDVLAIPKVVQQELVRTTDQLIAFCSLSRLHRTAYLNFVGWSIALLDTGV
jgi:hypothetical protein